MIDFESFDRLVRKACSALRAGEHLFCNLQAERSQFIRINASKVRQTGVVEDASLYLSLILESQGGLKKTSRAVSLTGLSYEDDTNVIAGLRALQEEIASLPVDPYAVLPTNPGPSRSETKGRLLDEKDAVERILAPAKGLDVVGFYAAGPVVRGMANSAGLRHWFSSESCFFDYSIYAPNRKAVKELIAGDHWDDAAYREQMERGREKVALLELPSRQLARGEYRVYLAPAAMEALIQMFSWECVSEAALRQGQSPLRRLKSGEAGFSPLFSLSEDFSLGLSPRFNDEGELAPEHVPVVKNGKLESMLVSGRTAREYGVPSNGAAGMENLRSPVMAAGQLDENAVLDKLCEGVYLSNLHYLNWSDQQKGRVTGMTRFACFWVENGKIVAPIESMRFDDSIFSLFGPSLEAVTRQAAMLPELSTYEARATGGMKVPGMISRMEFTL